MPKKKLRNPDLTFSKGDKNNLGLDKPSKSRGYMTGDDVTWTGEDTSKHIHDYLSSMGLAESSLRMFIREVMQSHTNEPVVGDRIINVNPQCKHYLSRGIVTNVESLPDEKGTTATYIVINRGDTYDEGDFLTKTLDQLDLDLE